MSKKQLKDLVHRARCHFRHYKLTVALVIAVLLTFVLTGVSLVIYGLGGFSRFDISRPGLEKVRQSLTKPSVEKTYDTTSPVTAKTVESFVNELDDYTGDLKKNDNFAAPSLSDEELQITTSQ